MKSRKLFVLSHKIKMPHLLKYCAQLWVTCYPKNVDF